MNISKSILMVLVLAVGFHAIGRYGEAFGGWLRPVVITGLFGQELGGYILEH